MLANNVAEPLVSLGRWDEAGEVIERALRLSPPPLSRSCQWRLAGDIALARGDLTVVAESVASMRSGSTGPVPRPDHLPEAADFYFDSVSQVRLGQWSAGRIALIGDAGYAAGPGGNGTGTAVVAAYVLAGELAAARGDYRTAFGRYERLLRPPLRGARPETGPRRPGLPGPGDRPASAVAASARTGIRCARPPP